MLVRVMPGFRARFASLIAEAARDRRGTVAYVLALAMVPLCGVIGLGVDYGRASRYMSKINRVADAAALSGARFATDKGGLYDGSSELQAQAKTVTEGFFTAALVKIGVDMSVTPTATVTEKNGAWTVKVDYAGAMTPSFARLFGITSLPVNGTATATISPGFPVLDIAMCVDSTGSMQPTLDTVKTNALNFYDNINVALKAKGMQPFPLVRVRMIYFKDYGGFGSAAATYGATGIGDPDPMNPSAFFALPDQASNFSAFVNPQVAYGGGDTPESGLECVNTAIDSPWLKVGETPAGFAMPVTDVYPIIVVWTDAPSHLPAYADSLAHPLYPNASTMPRDFAGLLAKWNDASKIDQAHKQIVFFGDPDISAPDNYGSYSSGWTTVKTWPKFTVGGSLLDANASMVDLLASGIANSGKTLRLSQ